MRIAIQERVRLKPNTNTLESHRPQNHHLAACVFAQQYSSATFISLRFHSRKEKFSAHFKHIIISIFYFFEIVSLKLSDLKLCKSESVCTNPR
jgi:hypothetical protein